MPPKIPPLNRQRSCPCICFGGPFANPTLRRVGLGHLAVGDTPRGSPCNGCRLTSGGKHLSVVVRRDDGYYLVMSTLVEIEAAAKQLPESDRQRLLISLIQSLRLTSQPLPPPRLFSLEEMQGWMDEDEADLKSLRVQK